MNPRRGIILMAVIICGAGAAFLVLRAGGGNGAAAPVGSAGPEKTELMLHCGAGIRPAAEALIAAFEAPGAVRISVTYAGSGRLLGQISASRKGDLFMPGAEFYVDAGIDQGLAFEDSKRIVARFVPVIFVQKGNPLGIRSLRDLAREGIRLGFGDERCCAVGKKTLEILEKNRIAYENVKDNVVYQSGTVSELGVAIQLGNVDAVIVWDATARNFSRYGESVVIPPEQNVISPIPIVVLTSSAHPAAARGFVEFVTSEAGRRILTEKGYTPAEERSRSLTGPAMRRRELP